MVKLHYFENNAKLLAGNDDVNDRFTSKDMENISLCTLCILLSAIYIIKIIILHV